MKARIAACSCLLVLLVTASSVFAQVSWTKYPGNPVFAMYNNNINNPVAAKYALEPNIIYDWPTGVYRMWYTSLTYGYGTTLTVNGALSLNGTDWFVQNDGPALDVPTTLGTFDASVRNPRVIQTDNSYLMYYVGTDANGRGSIGLATSQDGIHFVRHGSGPVFSGGSIESWDAGGAAFQDVRKEDSTYWMWYSSGNGASTSIGVATSGDGVEWVRDTANPVLTPLLTSEQPHVLQPSIVKVGQLYYMFYLGGQSSNRSVYFAYSTDKLHWTRGSSAPVLTGGSQSWEGTTIGGASVIYMAGQFRMWYSAMAPNGQWQIGYATSSMVPLSISKPSGSSSIATLSQNFPNPFNPATTIRFTTSVAQKVTLKVYDVLGSEVATLVDGQLDPGEHAITWDATRHASGTYICKLVVGNVQQTKMMVLVK